MKHIHHIIPRHMGGDNSPENLIELTIEEHAEAHRLLYETHGCEYDRIAYLGLSGQITTDEARRLAVSHSLKGIPKTDFHKHNISIAQKSRYNRLGGHPNKGGTNPPASEERKRKISESNKGNRSRLGKKNSDETKSKMSESAKLRPVFSCIRCGKTMQKASLIRYHGISGEKCLP